MQLDPEMKATLKREAKIERLAEEILTLREQMVEYDRKRNYNREALGAFRRGEVQSNNKLWMSFGDSFIRLPRKNLVGMIEEDQVKVNKLIEDGRAQLKKLTKELLTE